MKVEQIGIIELFLCLIFFFFFCLFWFLVIGLKRFCYVLDRRERKLNWVILES